MTLRGVAVPAAVGELRAQETTRELFVRMPEVAAEREDAAVDAGFDFAFEEWIPDFFDWAEIPVSKGTIPTQIGLKPRYCFFDDGIGRVSARCTQKMEREESCQPSRRAFAAPGAVGLLMREDC